MSGAVLADTGPLYALADPSDQFHDRAHRELEMIVSRNNPVLVVFPVLCETHTLVLRRLGGKYAANWLNEILSGSVPVNPEANDYLEAIGGLKKILRPRHYSGRRSSRATNPQAGGAGLDLRPALRNHADQRLATHHHLISRHCRNNRSRYVLCRATIFPYFGPSTLCWAARMRLHFPVCQLFGPFSPWRHPLSR
jgi:predicted nucleic acid-binding protein